MSAIKLFVICVLVAGAYADTRYCYCDQDGTRQYSRPVVSSGTSGRRVYTTNYETSYPSSGSTHYETYPAGGTTYYEKRYYPSERVVSNTDYVSSYQPQRKVVYETSYPPSTQYESSYTPSRVVSTGTRCARDPQGRCASYY